jgi:DNA helicase-2/ATP-dependent DNA helicase PcrA
MSCWKFLNTTDFKSKGINNFINRCALCIVVFLFISNFRYNERMKNALFDQAYKNLNKAQKEAVDSIDGPVMVVAGPGTGKTQVLSLRIANILLKTDIGANGILCLTFTNSGVQAMRERLRKYIGESASEVKVSTFHSFAQRIVEKYFSILDLEQVPELLDEQASILLFDEILNEHTWQYLRPRANPSQYFHDLKSLISLLKREHITPEQFGKNIDEEIKTIENDDNNISTRGESKGQLKKEAEKKIESLKRSKEAVLFYSLYEKEKKERSRMDYDDVLSYALEIVSRGEDVRSELKEENQYILVDEHQDSSGIQNEFLKAVWGDVELPNIFVVGDDRQLIYGFGGASLSYFENFKHTFGKAHLITLIENYRSTQDILDAADNLLQSSIAHGPLKSNTGGGTTIELYPCEYETDEILLAGTFFKQRIEEGVNAQECALLVPKNKQVRSAIRILQDMGLPMSSADNVSFFDLKETDILRNILKVIADPYNSVAISELLFVSQSKIKPLEAHAFLRSISTRNLSLNDLIAYTENSRTDLFSAANPIYTLGKKIEEWVNFYTTTDLYALIQRIGKEYFLEYALDHKTLTKNAEIVRTYLHLALAQLEKNPKATIEDFLAYLNRLESYNHHIPLAIIGEEKGIKVMTLHGSKGLEFEAVHIAHVNESTLMKGKRRGFVLPESIENLVEEKDELTAKRELYVALSRAKRFCSLSYALESVSGATLEVASIVTAISDAYVSKKSLSDSVEVIGDPTVYIASNKIENTVDLEELKKIVKDEYTQKNVSVTLLNNFFECPWKWYFNNLLSLPIEKSESLALGTIVHAGIEFILKSKIKPTEKSIADIVVTALNTERVSEKQLRSRVELNARAILSVWASQYYPYIHPSFMTERALSYHDKTLPHLKMYGKIDLTEKVDEKLIVTDFKTGSSKTKNAIEKRDEEGRMSPLLRQLAMYSYLLSGQIVVESKLLFLEEDVKDKNAVYTTHIGPEEIDLLVRDIREYDQSLSDGSWVTRECHFKPYGGEYEECEYCKKAKIYN